MALVDNQKIIYKLSNGQILTPIDEDIYFGAGSIVHTIILKKEKKGKYQATGNKPTGRPKGSKNKPKPVIEAKKIRLGNTDLIIEEPADNIL